MEPTLLEIYVPGERNCIKTRSLSVPRQGEFFKQGGRIYEVGQIIYFQDSEHRVESPLAVEVRLKAVDVPE